MTQHDLNEARGLCAYIDDSPSPYHCVEATAQALNAAGFTQLHEVDSWDASAGRFYVQRAGSLVAWVQPEELPASAGFRILGAHTDSPNLRVKPNPDHTSAGWRQLAIDVYGGALLNSWLDRDLGLSGRVFVRSEDGGAQQRLLRIDRPVLRVPQLAIHLHREIYEQGLKLNKQQHMRPVWGLSDTSEEGFHQLLGAELGVEGSDVLSFELMTHDLTPSAITGWNEEFVSAPRLDNQASCYLGLRALLARLDEGSELPCVPVLSLFDHEEVGSTSRTGADGPLLRTLLERSCLARGGSREDFHRACADSLCLSADMAHAVHPNWVEKHDPGHQVQFNSGPVLKLNPNQRYATESETEVAFQLACEKAEVPYQKWIMRSDLACGSTIGPLTAGQLGIPTVDVGNPQLAMHSAREFAGSHDPDYMRRAMTAFLG